ncbi:MAG: PDZ domain-containing protein [Pirellulales bacterium]
MQFGIKEPPRCGCDERRRTAHLAGIEAGEVITKVNGRTIEASQDIVNWIATARPGDVAQLTVLHGQQPRQVEVALTTDPRYAAALPAGIDMGSPASEVAALRTEVRQLRDELEATRAQLNQLARQVEELSKK